MRPVRIGTVSFLVDEVPHTVEHNVHRALGYIASAAALKCDVVCLPEMFRTINVASDPYDADSVPGPTADRLAESARAGRINVVATWYVADGPRIYNQTVLFDRAGAIAGIYRKAQPTGGEVSIVSAGDALPVFDLDIGRVAVMTCMDVYFPEICRVYAHKGAEIVFWPTVMHGPTQEGILAQLTSRAIDHSLYIVESNLAMAPPYAPYAGRYRPGTARVIDPNGDVIAQTGRRHGIAVADIDLDEVRLTSLCVLLREPDRFRDDLQSITRLDLYAREYASLAAEQNMHPLYTRACAKPNSPGGEQEVSEP